MTLGSGLPDTDRLSSLPPNPDRPSSGSPEGEARLGGAELETLFTNSPVGLGVVALEGRWLRANPALCRMLDYSESELRELSYEDVTHPDDREADRNLTEAMISGEIDSWEREKRYVRRDGEPVWVLISGSIVRDEQGLPLHYIAHIQDISARKRMERELEAAAEGFRLAREMMCVATLDGYLETLNGTWTEVLGWSAEELRSRPFIEFVHPDDRERTLAETAKFREGGESHLFRNRWMIKGGGWCWMSWSAIGVPEVGLVYCAARDVTERVEIEKALELQAQITANMAEGVSLVRVDDAKILYANSSLERILGFDPGELTGRDAVEVMWPDDLSGEEEAVRRAAAETLRETGYSTYEGRRRRKDGREIWCRTTSSRFEHPILGPVWVSIQQDITEERRGREVREELERSKSEFFSSVSHELRTPLTSILGYTALLREGSEGLDEDARRQVAVIERNARRQLRLVEDLLSIARSLSGEFALDQAEIDLATVVANAVEEMRPVGDQREIQLSCELEPDTVVRGDADRLAQVVANLLSNAIKFTPRLGRVEVGLRSQDDRAILTVADSGPEIDPTDRRRLFERFYRADDAETRRVSGEGLGLAIAKSIVEAHSGRIQVCDADDRPGNTFVITLPLSRAAGIVAAGGPSRGEASRQH